METKVALSIFCLKPYFKHFIQRIKPSYLLWAYKMKTLKSQLLKKHLIEIYKILDLSSPNIRQKYLFYSSCWYFFSLQSIAQWNSGWERGVEKSHEGWNHHILILFHSKYLTKFSYSSWSLTVTRLGLWRFLYHSWHKLRFYKKIKRCKIVLWYV